MIEFRLDRDVVGAVGTISIDDGHSEMDGIGTPGAPYGVMEHWTFALLVSLRCGGQSLPWCEGKAVSLFKYMYRIGGLFVRSILALLGILG